jgi:hypothetical protein
MVPDQTIVQGDLGPPLQVQLPGFPDLTDKTLTCLVKPANGCRGAHKTTLAGSDVLDAKGGFVQHPWVSPETQDAGLLLVTFNDGTVTYPEDDYFRVQVTPKLG